MRAIWKGSLSFALVNFPIKLFNAVSSKTLKFHSLCPDCHNQIKYKKWCPYCEKEVQKPLKGYKVGNEFVILDDADFERVKIKSTKVIEIQKFVDADKIPEIMHSNTYYIAPETGAEKIYVLLREVLQRTGKVGIGKFVLHNREHVVKLATYESALLLHTLFYKTEIRQIPEIPNLIQNIKLNEEEIKLCEEIINRMSVSEIDFGEYTDKYTEGLQKIIEAKLQGKVITIEEKVEQPKESLMDALRASLEALSR